jgi:hypothetical protein
MEVSDRPTLLTESLLAERSSEMVLELGRRCTAHRTATENFILGWNLSFRLLRWLGVDPLSPRGHVACGVLVAAAVFAAPLVATALVGDWSTAPVAVWGVIAATWGGLAAVMHPLYARWIDDHLALHRAVRDEAELRRLLAWIQRWYRVRTIVPMALTISVVILGVLFSVKRDAGLLPAGSAVLGGWLLFQVAEITYTIFMNGIESRHLARCHYALFGLSPIDSVPIRRALRGYNRVAAGHSFDATLFLVGFLVLLPASSGLVPGSPSCSSPWSTSAWASGTSCHASRSNASCSRRRIAGSRRSRSAWSSCRRASPHWVPTIGRSFVDSCACTTASAPRPRACSRSRRWGTCWARS